MGRKKSNKPKLSWRMQQFMKNPWASPLRAERISRSEKLSEDFMRKYEKHLYWEELCKYQDMSEKFIEEFINKIYARPLLDRGLINENFIRRYADTINWKTVSNSRADLSIGFLREFKDKIDWQRYFYNHTPTQKFVEEFRDVIPLSTVIYKVKMTEDFIRRYRIELEKYYSFWSSICETQDLSEEFIEEFADKVNWKVISYRQKLSRRMIEKYADKLDWKYMIANQKFDQKFIEKHIEHILPLSDWTWTEMIRHIKFGKRFLRKYKNKIRWVDLQLTYERIAFNIEHNISTASLECATVVDRKFIEEMKRKAGYYN